MHDYRCEHFSPEELVDEKTFEVFKDAPEVIYRLYPVGALKVIDRIQEFAGATYVNTWKWGGNRQWSGFRNTLSSWFSKGSQHTTAGAFDLTFKHKTVKEVYDFIMDNVEEFYALGLRRIEDLSVTMKYEGIDGRNWLHVDVYEGYWNKGGLNHIHTFLP